MVPAHRCGFPPSELVASMAGWRSITAKTRCSRGQAVLMLMLMVDCGILGQQCAGRQHGSCQPQLERQPCPACCTQQRFPSPSRVLASVLSRAWHPCCYNAHVANFSAPFFQGLPTMLLQCLRRRLLIGTAALLPWWLPCQLQRQGSRPPPGSPPWPPKTRQRTPAGGQQAQQA